MSQRVKNIIYLILILSEFFGCIVLSKCNFQLREQNHFLNDSIKEYRAIVSEHIDVLSKQNIKIVNLKKDNDFLTSKIKKHGKNN